jgi:hypothetical protein
MTKEEEDAQKKDDIEQAEKHKYRIEKARYETRLRFVFSLGFILLSSSFSPFFVFRHLIVSPFRVLWEWCVNYWRNQDLISDSERHYFLENKKYAPAVF